MKWFQVDSDTPNDPKIKAVIKRGLRAGGGHGSGARAAIGGLFLVWCYIADHGIEPGRGIDANRRPLPLDEMAEECEFDSAAELVELLDFCAAKEHIDREAWQERQEVYLPAMARRADEYSRKLLRRQQKRQQIEAQIGPKSPDSVRTNDLKDGQAPDSPVCLDGTVGTVGTVQLSSNACDLPPHTRASDAKPAGAEKASPAAPPAAGKANGTPAAAQGLPSAAPRTGAVMRPREPRERPLVSGPHPTHAACGLICLPAFLHEEWLKQRSGGKLEREEAADRELRGFYREQLEKLEGLDVPSVDPVKWWRAKYLERFGEREKASGWRSAPNLVQAPDDKYDNVVRTERRRDGINPSAGGGSGKH